jgi:hypothetical protein
MLTMVNLREDVAARRIPKGDRPGVRRMSRIAADKKKGRAR